MNRVISYFREVRSELKKVVWPSRRDTISMTIVVLVSVFIITLALWIMDAVLGGILRLII